MPVTINAGELRHPVAIRNLVSSEASDRGQEIGEWDDVADVWASIVQLTGSESETAHERNAEATHEVTLRYTADLNERSKIVFGDRVFSVLSIDNVEQRNRKLVCQCAEQKRLPTLGGS